MTACISETGGSIMTTSAPKPARRASVRLERILARVRGKQLETALRGRIEQSYRYAQRASRLRKRD